MQGPDAGSSYLLYVTEADALPEQRDFLLVLVLVGIVTLAIGGRSAHLDPFPTASGDVLIPAAFHPLLDGQSLHTGYLEQDSTDERGDRIDLPIRIRVLRL